jgi:hypothetical protein
MPLIQIAKQLHLSFSAYVDEKINDNVMDTRQNNHMWRIW